MWFVVINILFLIFEIIAGSSSNQCSENWLDCGNGRCIHNMFKCDGDNDCGNLKDEENCEVSTKECLSSQIQCISDKHCIPQKWHCDGEQDCVDGSDENECDNVTKKCDGFLCRNHYCIPKAWHCDGNQDCIDGSDEEYCFPARRCEVNDFKCDNGQCIAADLRCDGNKECDDGSDEVNCNKLCSDSEFTCSSGSCINQSLVCDSHKDCVDGSDEGLHCGANPFLVYSTLDEIRAFNSIEQNSSLIRRASQKATALHIDSKNIRVYWIELTIKSGSSGSIYSVKIDGSDFRTVLSDGLLVPEDVAVDYIANNLYITDSGLHQILKCKIDGSMRTVIHSENIEKPRSIDLDITEGFMYWSDFGDHSAGIYRSQMDGSNRIPLVSSNIGCPNGITIDHSTKKLYWVDAKLKTIEYISLDGNSRKVIYSRLDTLFHPYDLAVFEDTIYWTDWATKSLESCNKFTGSDLKVLYRQNILVMGVHVYHPVLTATARQCEVNEFKCDNGQCVAADLWCDGNKECDDGSDEVNCTRRCEVNEFKCDNGQCVSEDLRCDGNKDCDDGSDEVNCRKTCSGEDFQCKNGRCTLKSWRCDGRNDCGDNSDEEDCPPSATCSKEQITCLNGMCVSLFWRCDNETDCEDGSDELNCNEALCPQPGHYRCNNGQCIPQSWVCDGSHDCVDGSDEKICTKQCKANDFKCANGVCLTPSLFCNGQDDCGDGSDEVNCAPHTNCRKEMYQCRDGTCIYDYEVCDGHKDCIEGEDEFNCPSPICKPEEAMCPSKQRCIPKNWICDGDADCKDGWDEANCDRPKTIQRPKITPVTDSTCDTFFCYLTGQCLPWNKVCDGNPDCDDSFDEGQQCSRVCVNNGGCSHICQKMPYGSKCFCPEGYRLLPDNKTCVDIDECEILGVCSHFCNNTKGGYECICAQGYVLHNNNLCKAVGSATLVYMLGNQIQDLDLHSENKHIIVNATNVDMQGMDYDALSEVFFWTDKYTESINLFSAITGKRNVAVRSSLIPRVIRYDWITGNLYIKNASSSIVACTKDIRYCNTLIKPSKNFIDDIDIAPHSGLMFWTVWANEQQHQYNGLIVRSEMDGSHIIPIVSHMVSTPSAISVDRILNNIYWIDLKLNTLECADFHGLQRRLVLQSHMYHPIAMTVFEEFVYLADNGSHSIIKCNKFTGLDCAKVTETNITAHELLIVHKAMQPQGLNRCLDANCTQLCLLTRTASVCACDDMHKASCNDESKFIAPMPVVKCPRDYCHGSGECVVKDGQYLCEADSGSGDVIND